MEIGREPFNPIEGQLPCMNCKKPVDSGTAKIFANVFVCDGCYMIAERSLHRLESELRGLLLLAEETIRLALIEGRMNFGEHNPKEIPKSELLQSVIAVAKKRDEKARR